MEWLLASPFPMVERRYEDKVDHRVFDDYLSRDREYGRADRNP